MEIKKEILDDIVIISLQGRLNTNTAPELDNYIKAVISEKQINIILDLEKLDYISSAGLRILLVAVKAIERIHGKLILCSLSSFVNEVFELSGFSAIFQIAKNYTEAIEKICK